MGKAFMSVRLDDGGEYLEGGTVEGWSYAVNDAGDNITDANGANVTVYPWSEIREVNILADQEISGTPSTGSPQAYGRVDLPDVVLTKSYCPMTPSLFHLCCKGKAISEIIIVFTSDNGLSGIVQAEILYSIVLKGNVLTSHKLDIARYTKTVRKDTAAGSEDSAAYSSHGLVEQITINYSTIEQKLHTYTRAGTATVAPLAILNVAKGWNIGTNASL